MIPNTQSEPTEREPALLQQLRQSTEGLTAAGIVALAYRTALAGRVVLASSLSYEDQVLTHMVCAATQSPRIFTLDTGRLYAQTYATIERTMERYGFHFEVYAPDTADLERMVSEHGPDLFYRSVELRKLCCQIRKTDPLRRALADADVWICGLRREQSPTRGSVEPVEWDASHGLIKVNPLFDWSEERVIAFTREHNIPVNPLQALGLRSIGCASCTRAIGINDDIRAGRWWWEDPQHKECGLHRAPDFEI